MRIAAVVGRSTRRERRKGRPAGCGVHRHSRRVPSETLCKAAAIWQFHHVVHQNESRSEDVIFAYAGTSRRSTWTSSESASIRD